MIVVNNILAVAWVFSVYIYMYVHSKNVSIAKTSVM